MESLFKKKPFIIAEIGSNHCGQIKLALKAIDEAKKSGADAIKFQTINFKEIYKNPRKYERIYKNIEIPISWYPELYSRAKQKKILISTSPTYLKAVKEVEKYIDFFKVASPQSTGFSQIIDEIIKTKKKFIVSTGYCDEKKIKELIKKIKKKKCAILHCISDYPPKDKSINMNFLGKLKKISKLPVGFSDHTIGNVASILAIGQGATIIEKHVRLKGTSKNSPDYKNSIEFSKFKQFVNKCHTSFEMLGLNKKILTKNELKLRKKLLVYPFYKKSYFKGKRITYNDLIFLRSNFNSNIEIEKILNKKLKKNVKKLKQVKLNDF